MNNEQLQMFVNLARQKHFHKAAESCFVSPSTLSRNIQQLEKTLEVKLFDRNNRSVSLTPAGETFLTYARQALLDWNVVKDTLAKKQGQLHGNISLYCSVTASYSFLYKILTRFRQLYPHIALTLHTGDPALALERVTFGQEDLAIAMKPDSLPSGIEFKAITRSHLLLIQPLNADFTSSHNTNTQGFWNEVPLVVPERGIARDWLDQWFARHRISPNIYAQVAGHEAIVSMVGLGFGIGLVPQIVVDNSPLATQVRPFSHSLDLPECDLGFCVLAKNLKRPIIEAFWSQI